MTRGPAPERLFRRGGLCTCMVQEELRRYVRLLLQEDLKNLRAPHERTVAGADVLRKMHDAPGVLQALSQVDSATELAHVIEAIIDAVPVVRRHDVLDALTKVTRHEKKVRLR